MATVMAAVDLARVRLPGQAEGGRATQQQQEEAEEKLEELSAWQQARETQLESPAAPGFVLVSQVGVGSLGGWDYSPCPAPVTDNQTVSLKLQTEKTEASPRVPHFTVSKVSVPKHEPSHEVRGWRRVHISPLSSLSIHPPL